MATIKELNARFRVKKDTAANWEKENPVLLDGEQIFVITAAGETRIKVGDGTKTYTQLPFTDEPIRTLISNKVDKEDGKVLSTNDYTTEEKEKLAGLNNYTLPAATSSALGGVKSGGDITVDANGAVTVNNSTLAQTIAIDTDSEKAVDYNLLAYDVDEPGKVYDLSNAGIFIQGMMIRQQGSSESIRTNVLNAEHFAGDGSQITNLNASHITSGTLSEQYLPSKINASKLTGTIPTSVLPSYVDDVIEAASNDEFPAPGESGKIYVNTTTNLSYRWSGSQYVEISPSIALGETSSTAYRGDYGAAAYAHAVTNKGVAKESGLYKITTNSEGHVTAGVAVTKDDIVALGIPAQDTTYEAITIEEINEICGAEIYGANEVTY